MTEKEMARNPVKIMDLTLRDGHQSLFATRMRTEDMIPIAEQMDQVGFFAIEVWGGATFDAMHRFLNEDPWERPKTLKRYIKKTPLSMLLRGQNLVGYRHYADDVVKAFLDEACEAGIEIFRVFDALNDFRNFRTSVKVIKAVKSLISTIILTRPGASRIWGQTPSALRIWPGSWRHMTLLSLLRP
jgi:pyruvate carboxylase subunit B